MPTAFCHVRLGLVLVCCAVANSVAWAAADPFQEALNKPILKDGEALTQLDLYVLARIAPFKLAASAEDWQREAARIRQRVLDEIIFRGVPSSWRTAKPAVVWGDTIATGKGYTLRKLRYEALPGFWIPAVLYEPDKLQGKVPAILNVNGHASTGKQTPYKQIRCINEAKRGMLAMNLEWIGMGQLRGPGYGHNQQALLDVCGRSGVSVFYLAMSRGLDVLLDHPHADPERTAVTGVSGGGWQSITLSSLDTRVKLSVPVAGYSAVKQRVANRGSVGDLEQNPCDLASIADYVTLTALLVPRPALLIYNAKDDCCFVADTVKPNTFDPVVPVYQQAGAAGLFEFYVNHDPGTHNYERDNRQQFYRFVNKHFLRSQEVNDAEIPSDDEVQTAEALHVPLPEGNATFVSLAADAAKELPRRDGQATPAAQRERLASILRCQPWTATFTPAGDPEKLVNRTIVRYRVKVGEEWVIPALLVRGETSARTTLLLADGGLASCKDKIDELLNSGSQVLAIDPILIGQGKPNRAIGPDAMLLATVGQRPLGIQVSQVIAALQAATDSLSITKLDAQSIGPRSGLILLCVAALRKTQLGEIQTDGLPDSLKDLLKPEASYDQTPEPYCFGLLEWFDRQQLEDLAKDK